MKCTEVWGKAIEVDKELAIDYGLENATLIVYFCKILEKHGENGWIEAPIESIHRYNDFLSKKQIERCMEELVIYGVLDKMKPSRNLINKPYIYKLCPEIYNYYFFGGKLFEWPTYIVEKTPACQQKRYSGNRDKVLERDSYRCRVCGISIRNTKRILVHHIDGYFKGKPENNRENKMISLCSSCHARVHKGDIDIPRKVLFDIGYFDEE